MAQLVKKKYILFTESSYVNTSAPGVYHHYRGLTNSFRRDFVWRVSHPCFSFYFQKTLHWLFIVSYERLCVFQHWQCITDQLSECRGKTLLLLRSHFSLTLSFPVTSNSERLEILTYWNRWEVRLYIDIVTIIVKVTHSTTAGLHFYLRIKLEG